MFALSWNMREILTNLKDVGKNSISISKLSYKLAGSTLICYYLTSLVGGLAPIAIAFFIQQIIDSSLININILGFDGVTLYLILLILTYLIRELVYYGTHYQYLDFILRNKLQMGLNTKFLEKVSSLDLAYLEDPNIQDLITKTKDTFLWEIPNFISAMSRLLRDTIGLITIFLSLMVFGWWLPMIILAISIPRGIWKLYNGKFAWSMYGSGAPELKKLWYLRSVLGENSSIIESKVFQSRTSLINKTIETQNYLFNLNKKPIIKHYIGIIWLSIFEFGVLFWLISAFVPDVHAGVMTVGAFTFLISMSYSLASNGSEGLVNFSEMHNGSLYIHYYFQLQSLPKIITEKPNPVSFEEVKPPLIEFKNVSFSYPKGDPILKNLSFTINPGETVALVGVNGAGKTTIIKLLCRFYDVTDGQILINGIDIRDLSLSNWYQHLGTLFQHFIKYQFTVKENIMLGNSKIYDEDKMKLAAQQSGAIEFIDKFEKGYDQMLGKQFEDGQELSGGQWQKLAIARAFYEQAPVLIMDEPTSAIDAEAEKEIFENLLSVYKGKTLLLVSHRFSTVRNAEKIIVLENGQITESGSHQELMQNPQKYAKMFEAQAQGYR
jgi:ATP-binding cassette, subfamily B, bacterial